MAGPGGPGYPVTLAVGGLPCLVVGGGPVAARKAAGLAAGGAAVTMVAPAFGEEAETLAAGPAPAGHGAVTLVRRSYGAGEAAAYRLVLTATGLGEVDAAVAADAEAGGVWVNSADDPEHCTFTLPAVHRDGPVTLAVSTGGASPALAAWLRGRAARALGPRLGDLARLLAQARAAVRAAGRPTESVDWGGLLDGPLPALVSEGRLEAARALLAAAVDPADGGPEPSGGGGPPVS